MPEACRGKRAAHAGQHADGAAPGDPLDVDDVVALAHAELGVLVGDLVEVLEEGQGGLAERHPARGERSDLPQAQADAVRAVAVALERPGARRSATSRCVVVSGSPARRAISDRVSAAASGVKASRTPNARAVTDRSSIRLRIPPMALPFCPLLPLSGRNHCGRPCHRPSLGSRLGEALH